MIGVFISSNPIHEASTVRISFMLTALVLAVSTESFGGIVSTTDPALIAAFQLDRTVLDFDEITVGASPCFVLLDPNQYAAQGIVIRAQADGSTQTHVAQLPECGTFGSFLSPPNVIGGGTTATDPNFRETIRFDFPELANAIGANNDGTGSRTTLTAYRADDTVIAAVSGDQGFFMGIDEPNIAYALWTWDFDQSVPGFSLDNVTFSIQPGVIPTLSQWGVIGFGLLLLATMFVASSRRLHG